ncbi:MAG: iron-containing alcohol dehydrogenase, partial [Betaproteobacteria bacterium]
MTRIVNVSLGARSYPIHIGSGLIDSLSGLLPADNRPSHIAVVTNPTVAALYLERVTQTLGAAGFSTVAITVPDGEAHKTIDTWSSVHDRLLAARLDRKSAVLALGGGVVGDIAGFAAATYQRGIDFIQVPTTLLA